MKKIDILVAPAGHQCKVSIDGVEPDNLIGCDVKLRADGLSEVVLMYEAVRAEISGRAPVADVVLEPDSSVPKDAQSEINSALMLLIKTLTKHRDSLEAEFSNDNEVRVLPARFGDECLRRELTGGFDFRLKVTPKAKAK